MISDCNNNNVAVDLTDQIASYGGFLRRSHKWYREVSFNMILNTMVNNARIIYNMKKDRNMELSSFKEQLCLELLKIKGN